MSYAVLHMQKIKGNGVTGMQIHNQREKESDTNADIEKDKSHLNYDLENDKPIDYHEKVKNMIDERVDQSKRKVRKDAVRVASFLVTSDKAFFERIGESEERRFFENAHDFFKEKYGKENIAYAMVHKDEKTPHMHLGFVPITEDNRLSAKDFFGERKQLRELQDEFHAHMNENGFDLKRGISSDKKHLETAKFKLQTTKDKINILENELDKKQDEKKQIDKSIKKIKTELNDLHSSADHSKEIDQIEFKEKGLIGPKTVNLARSDFDNMKSLAKVSEVLKIENKAISERNMQLEKENSHLDKENRDLKRENRYLNRVIDQFKANFKDQIDELSFRIGLIKSNVIDKMKMPFYKKFFKDEDEIEAAQKFPELKKQYEKQKELENEHELEM